MGEIEISPIDKGGEMQFALSLFILNIRNLINKN
jgi:hypothetical protein